MHGQDALDKFNDEIQIMFVDWNMPNMTGVEFSKAVRDKEGTDHFPIIMVTAEKMHKTINHYFDFDGNIVGDESEEKEEKRFFSSILKS